MIDINIVILGCALVTFIPRLIPAIFVDKLNFGPKVEKFLNLIPYTALAALICPGVLTVDNQLAVVYRTDWSSRCSRPLMEKGSSGSYRNIDCGYFSDGLFYYSNDLASSFMAISLKISPR